jgi:hypothetical protein
MLLTRSRVVRLFCPFLLYFKELEIEGRKMVRLFQTTTVSVLAIVTLLAIGLCAESKNAPAACPVTKPNGSTPPGERSCPNCLGNGDQWAGLYPEGKVVFSPGGPGFVLEDGSLSMKFWWWRGGRGRLTITGRRLDATAPPLRARIPEGYGDTGFQATALIFPTVGCWQVTGKVGESRLTFVTLVVKAEERK